MYHIFPSMCTQTGGTDNPSTYIFSLLNHSVKQKATLYPKTGPVAFFGLIFCISLL